MRIMLVNDDGFRANGIRTMAHALMAAGHQVAICAPDRERSAASHALSVSAPLTATPFSENGLTGYAIDGTPADCAQLGLYLLENQVDMVVSGINHGPNIGGACVYSGTVGAAIEAAMRGFHAMAVSLDGYAGQRNFEACASVALKVLDWAARNPLDMGEIYNLNVPDVPYASIKGVRSASLSRDFLGRSAYEKLAAPDGSVSYRSRLGEFEPNTDPECDALLLKEGWATLTPLTWSMAPHRPKTLPEIKL